MDRSATLLLLALVIAAFGIYEGLNGVALLMSGGTSFALSFLLQGVLGLTAAYGVARAQPWAPAVLLVLALVVAAVALFEGLVLGILPWLYALLIAILAIVLALVIGNVVRGAPARDLVP